MIDKELYEKLKANNLFTNYLVLTDKSESLRIMLEVTILAWLESRHARNGSVDFALSRIYRALNTAEYQFKTAIKQAYPDDYSWSKQKFKLQDFM